MRDCNSTALGLNLLIGAFALLLSSLSAHAREPSRYEPNAAIVAVYAGAAAEGRTVRLLVYADADSFLEQTAVRYESEVGADGVARIVLDVLADGEYAFFSFLDVNGDGILPRGKL